MSLEDLNERVQHVETREDLIAFIMRIHDTFRDEPGELQNDDLLSYLEALAAAFDAVKSWYPTRGLPVPDQPSWRILAERLLTACIYD